MSRRDPTGEYGVNNHMASSSHPSGQSNGNAGRGQTPVSPLEELMRRKGVDDAWTALEEMQRQGINSDRFTVSRMLMKTVGEGRGRLNPGKVYRGISLVERFIQIQPEEADEVLFNALLDTCCRIKDICRLDATVTRMRELQIPPSHVTLGILVKAYGQSGDIARVLKVWEEMAEQRRQANAVTYGCMIDACVKCGQMEKAMEIFHDMKKRRKHRNTILYTTLIKGCGLEKDLQTALTLFREMRDEGVPYNTITYNSIIDVCIKCSDVLAAEELLRDMLAPGNNLEPDLITYSTLLKGYCHIGDLDKALQVAETIKACGLKCDELVYNTLMDGCVKANDLSAGIGLFAEMTQAGMKPSSITHSILVRLYQRNGYKGDCFDTVALLYMHHGLERPTGMAEGRSGKGGGKGGDNDNRQRNRGRTNNNNNNNNNQPAERNFQQNNSRDHHPGQGVDGGQSMGHPNFPGPVRMAPHMGGGYGGGPPVNMGMGTQDPFTMMSGAALQQHINNFDVDRGMSMYMQQQQQQQQQNPGHRGMGQVGPPGTFMHQGMSESSYSGNQMMDPALLANLGLSGGLLGAPAGPLGTDPRRFPRGRMVDDGLDASRLGAQLPLGMPEDHGLPPHLPPFFGGFHEAPYGGPMPGGGHKSYMERYQDGVPSHLLGVQCGGPAAYEC